MTGGRARDISDTVDIHFPHGRGGRVTLSRLDL
jgi:hypothetical protein